MKPTIWFRSTRERYDQLFSPMSSQLQENLIFIGITTYNRLDLLRESVLSILNQTYKTFILVISNDNPERVLTLENLTLPFDSRIVIVNQRRNLGEIANLNWLMNYAQAPYFTWLADDDLLHPDYLRIMVNELNKDPKLPAVFSNYIHGVIPPDHFSRPVVAVPVTISSENFLLLYSARKLQLIGCYGLFRIEEIRRIGGFIQLGKGFSPGSDTLIPILLAANSVIRYVDIPLVYLRTHDDSVSSTSSDLQAYISAEYDFLRFLRAIIEKFSHDLQSQVIRNFREWFMENHLSVLYRDLTLSRTARNITFMRVEIGNNYRIAKEFGFLLVNINLFFKAMRLAILRTLQESWVRKLRNGMRK